MGRARLDVINYWSEVKLDIVRKYAQAYSTILAAQRSPALHHSYVDAFAGAGVHVSRQTGEFILGSPLNALNVHPPFKEYHLVDLDGSKVESLRSLVSDHANVTVYHGDCNHVLLKDVFPRARWEKYCRALCLLDPYGLHLDWSVVETAGKMKTVEIFLNFPMMDMNMNVLWRDPARVNAEQAARMDRFWGDHSWREVAYRKQDGLFGEITEKLPGEAVVRAYQARLRTVAGFKHVPDPVPMRNSTGGVLYYLFFASAKPVAADIVKWIFDKYRARGVV